MRRRIRIAGIAAALLCAALPGRANDPVDTCVEYLESHPTDPTWQDACVDALLDEQQAPPSSGSSSTAAAIAGPSRRITPVTNASKLCQTQNEAAIAMNPNDPQQIFVVSHPHEIRGGSPGLFAAYSTDGGLTWSHTDPSDGVIADGDAGDPLPLSGGDPTLGWDAFGNLFVAYLSSAGIAQVVVAVSTDGGQSFSHVATLGTETDYPTITTGPSISSSPPGAVYVSYRESSAPGPGNPIVVAGAPVSGSGAVGSFDYSEEMPGSRTRNCNYGEVAVGPDGQVLVACQRGQIPSEIIAALDPDGRLPGGQPFHDAVLVGTTNIKRGGETPEPSANRAVSAEVGLAFDVFRGPTRGRAYIVYADEIPDDSEDWDIFVQYSDEPQTPGSWQPRVRVNDDATTTTQFLPTIAVDPTTGGVAVGWHDARTDIAGAPEDLDGAANSEVRYWAATSGDGGVTFSESFQVSSDSTFGIDCTPAGDPPNPPLPTCTSVHIGTSDEDRADLPEPIQAQQFLPRGDLDFGDYSDIAYVGRVFYAVWADNSNATEDNPDFQFDPGNPNPPGSPCGTYGWSDKDMKMPEGIEGMDIYTAPEPGRFAQMTGGIALLMALSRRRSTASRTAAR